MNPWSTRWRLTAIAQGKRPSTVNSTMVRKVFKQFNLATARNAPRPGKPNRHDFLYTARSSCKKDHAVTEQNRLIQAMSHVDEGPFGLLPNAHELCLQHLAGLGIQ